MERFSKRRGKERRIIEAAAHVFSVKGFSGTSVSEIAENAGVGKGTIYEYFDSKEELFFKVFEWFSEELASSITVGISALGGSASGRLSAIGEATIASWDQIKGMFSLVFEFWAASASSHSRDRFKASFRDIYSDYRTIISSLISEGIARGEFRADLDAGAIAAALVGTWDALFLQAWFDEDFDLQGTAKRFMETLQQGMKKKEGQGQ